MPLLNHNSARRLGEEPGNKLGRIGDTDGTGEAQAVGLHRSARETKFIGNVGIGLALRHKGQNLALSPGQPLGDLADGPIHRLEAIKRRSERIAAILRPAVDPTPESLASRPGHDPFIIIDGPTGQVMPPHITSPHEVCHGRIEPRKARIHQFVTPIPEQLGKLVIAVADDAMGRENHRHRNVSERKFKP